MKHISDTVNKITSDLAYKLAMEKTGKKTTKHWKEQENKSSGGGNLPVGEGTKPHMNKSRPTAYGQDTYTVHL